MTEAERLRRRLSARHAFALTLIAVLAVLGQGLVQLSLSSNGANGHEINLAGRQRMLSQRIAKHAFAAAAGDARHLDALGEDTREWTDVHRALLDGDAARDLTGIEDPAIRASLDSLSDEVEAVVVAARRFRESGGRDAQALGAIARAERAFLPTMDRVVFALDASSGAATRRLRWIELALLVSTLLALAVLARFVFKPAAEAAAAALRTGTAGALSPRRRVRVDAPDGLWSVRTMLGIGSAVIVALWWVQGGDEPGTYDPFALRLAVGGAGAGALVLTLVSLWARRYHYPLGLGFGLLCVTYVSWLATMNGLDAMWALSVTSAAGVCMYVLALYGPRTSSVLQATTMILAIVTGFIAVGPRGEVQGVLVVVFVSVFAITAVIAGLTRLSTARALKASRDEADDQGRLLRTVIDAIPDMIFATDREGRCVLRNLADAQAIGYEDPEDTLGLTVFDTVDGDLAQTLWEKDQAIMDSGEAQLRPGGPRGDRRPAVGVPDVEGAAPRRPGRRHRPGGHRAGRNGRAGDRSGAPRDPGPNPLGASTLRPTSSSRSTPTTSCWTRTPRSRRSWGSPPRTSSDGSSRTGSSRSVGVGSTAPSSGAMPRPAR